MKQECYRVMRMMKKETASKVPLKYIKYRVLSPYLLVIVLISLSFTTIFLCRNNSLKIELTARFPVLLFFDGAINVADIARDSTASSSISSTTGSVSRWMLDGLRDQKRSDGEKFVWSSELKGWTLKLQNSPQLGDVVQGQPPEETNSPRDCIWPEDCVDENYPLDNLSTREDRIINQLRLFDEVDDGKSSKIVNNNDNDNNNNNDLKIFKILPPASMSSLPIDQELFITESCPINRCSITYDKEQADALIFENSDVIDEPPKYRRINQIWIAYLLESPCHTFDKRFKRFYRGRGQFNWTASYRSDSDLVAPYSKFVPFQDKIGQFNSLKSLSLNENFSNPSARMDSIKKIFPSSQPNDYHKSLIRGKQGKVAWFASNCNAANNRLEYARELAQYIQVDIYGRCGNLTCDKWNQTGCFDMINKDYKFYLSFENSNCRQYITEKFYRNALGYNDLNYLMLPIVMGPPKEDYQRFAPPASFIHVNDFESPKELAKYLKQLDSDDVLYYSYFNWKTLGQFIDTKFMCRVCSLLHNAKTIGKRKSYSDIKHWWTQTCKTEEVINGSSKLVSRSCCVP